MRLIYAAAAFGLAISAPAAAQNAEQQVREASAAWNEAIRTGDAAVLERLMAPEFSLAGGDGANPVPRAVWLANRAAMRMDAYATRIVDLRVRGPFAVATVEGEWDVTMRGRRLTESFLVRDFWVQRNGRWQVFRRYRPE